MTEEESNVLTLYWGYCQKYQLLVTEEGKVITGGGGVVNTTTLGNIGW